MPSLETYFQRNWLPLRIVADILGYGVPHLHLLAKAGRLKLTKINGANRVLVTELHRYIDEELHSTFSDVLTQAPKLPSYLKQFARSQQNDVSEN